MQMGFFEKHGWRSWIGMSMMAFFSVTSLNAQCVVGGTEFETSKTLCNPSLTNDDKGWFSKDVDDLLDAETKGCDYYEGIGNAIQTGMPSNTITTQSELFNTKDWNSLKATNGFLATKPGGFTAITANPKLIDPVLSEGNGTNMLVNAGTDHAKGYFMAYTVNGLKPGSSVTLTMDVYYLIDEASLKAAYTASGKAVSMFGSSVQYQTSGAIMPAAGIKCATSLDANGSPATTMPTTIAAKSGAQKVTIKGTANSVGTVTFYVSRTNPNSFPIGIDNIEITGDIQPVITSAKMMPVCPENPVMLYLKHTYPEGTTYSWSMSGSTETSTSRSFSCTPKEANKTYKVTCTVTPPGCKSVSASFEIETKECCTMKDASGNDLPMAETNIFYDDFGSFPDDRTYEYRDAKGVVHTVPVDGGLWTDVTRPFSTKFQPGSDIKGDKYSGNGDITSCITNVNPYTPGVNGDASGTGRGGMLVFDVDKAFGKASGLKDQVIYEREICGLCKGKEITFSASFGAINNNPAGVGEMAIVLRKGSSTGEDLLKGTGTSGMLHGDEGWRTVEKKFTVENNSYSCVVLQVVNITDTYGTSQGDFAIDDITFSVCTPPDVAVDAVLSGHAKDLLDLCVDDVLTLKAEISDVAKQFYGSNIGYLFQFTYQDPSVVDDDKIKWNDLSEIQNNGEFVIKDPATHPAFEKIQEGDVLNVYFRVVIGDKTYLHDDREEWESMSALSPCRAISISSIPIVAGLNCAKCSELDKKRTFTADKGRLSGKKLELCKEDGAATIGLKDPVHGIDKDDNDYYDYEVAWYKDEVKSANLLGKKKCNSTDNTAPEVTVDWSDVKEDGTKYIISFHDYFDPAMTTTPCDLTDTIIVYANPTPEKKLKTPDPFCEGKLTDSPELTISGYDILWFSDDAATKKTDAPAVAKVKAEDSPLTLYYVLEDTKTGCRGDVNTYVVKVNPIPAEDLAAIDPFCEGSKDAKLPTSANKYTVKWTPDNTDLSALSGKEDLYEYTYTVTSAEGCESEPVEYKFRVMPYAEADFKTTEICGETTVELGSIKPSDGDQKWTLAGSPTSAADVQSFKTPGSNGTLSLVIEKDGVYCPSKAVEKEIYVKEIPAAPTTTQLDKVVDPGKTFTITDAAATVGNATLEWVETTESATDAPTSGWSATTPTIPLDDEKAFYFFVRQTNADGCVGEAKKVKVTVNSAPVPVVKPITVCVGTAVDLTTLVEFGKADDDPSATYTYRWFPEGVKGEKGKGSTEAPSVDVSTPGKYTFDVTQVADKAPNPESNPATIEVIVMDVRKPNLDGNRPKYCASSINIAEDVVASLEPETDYKKADLDGFYWTNFAGKTEKGPKPDINVTQTTTYEYEVTASYTIPTTGEECKSKDPASFTVDVTFVPKLKDGSVLYLKSDSKNGTFEKTLTQQEPDLIQNQDANSTLTWYNATESACGTEVISEPTPKVDPSVKEGEDQYVYYCVTQTVDGCESEKARVEVTISDAPQPDAESVVYCEGAETSVLVATINDKIEAASNYELLWYDADMNKLSGAPKPESKMKDGETMQSVYTYYVTQKHLTKGAESGKKRIFVTVYARPTLQVTTPPTVCSTPVSLKDAVELTNTVAGQSYKDEYFSDAAAGAAVSESVEVSGTYYARYSYSPAEGQTCVSDMNPIEVTIDEMEMTSSDVSTCPDMNATFTVDVQTNVAASNVRYEWTGTNGNSDSNSDKTAATFTTREFIGGDYGDTYDYHLVVTAGTCTKEGDYQVKLGEGPVEGTLTLSDTENSELPTKEYTNSLTEDPFYFCGKDFTIVPAYKKDNGTTYTLKKPDGSSEDGESFKGTQGGVYTLSFSNGCPTKVSFKVFDAGIEITNDPVTLEMCEKEKFEVPLKVDYLQDYTVAWYKDNELITGATGNTYTIFETKGTDSGVYKAVANSHGCLSEDEIGKLKVKTYIQLTNQTEPYIVVRGESVSIPLTITEPSSQNVESISWTESGSETFNGKTNTLASVEEDHKYEIILSDPDHCDAKTTAEVWVDAKLVLSTDFKDTICYNEEHTFTIDTTGTGAFRKTPKGVITVYERMNGTTTDVTNLFSEQDGKYVAKLSPKKDATYEVTFDYPAQNQILNGEEKAVVLQPIEVIIPAAQTVCAGDEATITLTKVSPEGTVIVWDDDSSITSGTEGESITVKAEYGEGFNHKSEYTYGFTASYAGCQELKLAAKLNVDEPLTGEIESNAPICAGTNIEMDASSYEAETYLWMKVDSTNEMSGSKAVTRLTQPTTFLLHVTRGVCDADAVYKAEVTENPTIERVDSVDIRSRRIVVSGGTPGYTYSVDNKEYDVMDTKIDLLFTSHMAYVMDANNCSDTMPFYMEPPAIIVPPFFSPNGDATNEQWIPTNLKEVYPDALVTIFDRYGKKLAQYRANEEDWDGTYEGKMMPSTDYWYEIDIEEIDKQYIGHFTLIRR